MALCVLALAVYLLSLGHELAVTFVSSGYRTYSLSLRRGWIRCGQFDMEQTTRPIYPPRGLDWHWARSRPIPEIPDRMYLPYRGSEYEEGPGWEPLYAVPAWPLALAAAVVAIPLAPRRRRQGTCRRCGYDLRGLTSSVCPECGTLAPTCASSTSPLA